MKKMLVFLLAFLLPILSAMPAAAENKLPDEVIWNRWYQDERARLTVGTVTPMEGRFFTNLWGGTASDMDAQMLLHAASPVRWDGELDRFVFDRSVLEDAAVLTNSDGSLVIPTVWVNCGEILSGTDLSHQPAQEQAKSLLAQITDQAAQMTALASRLREDADRGVFNGRDGAAGAAGTDGATFTPSVSQAGVLSWTNDGNKQNPASVDLVSAVINALPVWQGGSY